MLSLFLTAGKVYVLVTLGGVVALGMLTLWERIRAR